MRAHWASIPAGRCCSGVQALGLAKSNRAAIPGSQAASGRCASIDTFSLFTMPQLTGNPLDWFLLHCTVRWLLRWYLLLQRQEAQLHGLEIAETRFPSSVPCFYRRMASVA